tara:strand:+ start:610 stop:1440 length:831 start_codon:yes stop_codon:yes gene_type:complete
MAFSQQTVTFSETSKGFPSFYSFLPEQIQGMNGYLYTFYQGKLWQHNSKTAPRNNFYGGQFSSTITSVFNQSPLENKIFKTIGIQSDSAWSATVKSDIQDTGFISSSFFVQKEGEWFAYLRSNAANPVSGEFPLRSVQGVARQSTRTGVGTGVCVLSFNMVVDLGSMINQGDIIYFATGPFGATDILTPQEAGAISSVNYDAANNINNITINNNSVALPATGTEVYILYIKNQIAESNGILGHYGEFTLTSGLVENPNSVAVELFAVDSDVMKSFP